MLGLGAARRPPAAAAPSGGLAAGAGRHRLRCRPPGPAASLFV